MWMINFFKKKEKTKKINHKLQLTKIFPWITKLEDNYINLSNQDINIRINEILDLKKYFKTQIGINQLLDLKDSLVISGYPENAAQLEIDFFLELFEDDTIKNLLFNDSAGLHLHQKNGYFNKKVKVNKDFGLIRTSIGKVFIVGSSNTLLPVLTSLFLSYIAGNNTVVQLSSLHVNCVPKLIENIPFDGAKHIHFTNLLREKEEDLSLIEALVTNINWNVINVWGGNNSLDFYNKIISKNTYRPRIVNMEPLTGALIIQQDYFEQNLDVNIKNLSSSIQIMGQQLCSSPTIGFLLNYNFNQLFDSIFENIIIDIEENYTSNNLDENNSMISFSISSCFSVSLFEKISSIGVSIESSIGVSIDVSSDARRLSRGYSKDVSVDVSINELFNKSSSRKEKRSNSSLSKLLFSILFCYKKRK